MSFKEVQRGASNANKSGECLKIGGEISEISKLYIRNILGNIKSIYTKYMKHRKYIYNIALNQSSRIKIEGSICSRIDVGCSKVFLCDHTGITSGYAGMAKNGQSCVSRCKSCVVGRESL